MARTARAVTVIPSTINPLTRMAVTSVAKRRVAGYARVSTDSDEQFTSYEAQIDYYTQYIKRHAEWQFVKVYTDDTAIMGLNQNPVQTGVDLVPFFFLSALFSANEGVPA